MGDHQERTKFKNLEEKMRETTKQMVESAKWEEQLENLYEEQLVLKFRLKGGRKSVADSAMLEVREVRIFKNAKKRLQADVKENEARLQGNLQEITQLRSQLEGRSVAILKDKLTSLIDQAVTIVHDEEGRIDAEIGDYKQELDSLRSQIQISTAANEKTLALNANLKKDIENLKRDRESLEGNLTAECAKMRREVESVIEGGLKKTLDSRDKLQGNLDK